MKYIYGVFWLGSFKWGVCSSRIHAKGAIKGAPNGQVRRMPLEKFRDGWWEGGAFYDASEYVCGYLGG